MRRLPRGLIAVAAIGALGIGPVVPAWAAPRSPVAVRAFQPISRSYPPLTGYEPAEWAATGSLAVTPADCQQVSWCDDIPFTVAIPPGMTSYEFRVLVSWAPAPGCQPCASGCALFPNDALHLYLWQSGLNQPVSEDLCEEDPSWVIASSAGRAQHFDLVVVNGIGEAPNAGYRVSWQARPGQTVLGSGPATQGNSSPERTSRTVITTRTLRGRALRRERALQVAAGRGSGGRSLAVGSVAGSPAPGFASDGTSSGVLIAVAVAAPLSLALGWFAAVRRRVPRPPAPGSR